MERSRKKDIDNDTERKYRKKTWTNLKNSYKKWSKEIKSDNFCYRKVVRAITRLVAIEKRNYEPIYKADRKNEAKGFRATTFAITKLEERLIFW